MKYFSNIKKTKFERYSRQIVLTQFGLKGQRKLLSSKVLIIGCGGLGSAAAYYLAAAGVGTIGLVDSESVEISNLQRQILYSTDDVGEKKVKIAKEKLHKLNPDIKILAYQLRVVPENIREIIKQCNIKEYDIILECSDNFPTKYAVNDICVITRKPLVYASVLGYDGQVTTIIPFKTACLRCICPQLPPENEIPSCKEVGILGTLAGITGLLQATETIKYLLNLSRILKNQILMFNALTMEFKKI
ncbi:MAG: HesA/MoeB/ThiF family protein, partial [Endomicrobia bacterium]|nr:HesA/MoeB/ThiF family protein [Endomicrobiia bacterium]